MSHERHFSLIGVTDRSCLTTDVIELLLVLIYRHLDYYSAGSGVGQQRDGVFRPRTTRVMSGSGNYDRDMLIRVGIDRTSLFHDRTSELSLVSFQGF